ncbi:hypothetical protein [Desulfovibrio cuneatus]|nr:hypothetical protein [Desulfovibrio cuneatus]
MEPPECGNAAAAAWLLLTHFGVNVKLSLAICHFSVIEANEETV